MTRADLDHQMGQALCQLALCSHVAAPGYEPKSRSGATDSVVLSGDTGNRRYAADYGPPFAPETRASARTDEQRLGVLNATRDEIRHLRGHGLALVPRPAESEEERRTRILEDTEGSSPAEVAMSSLRVSERTLRKWRREDGRNLETGRRSTERLPASERRQRVLELAAQGLNTHQIARRLGEHHMTIGRDLKRSEAA